MVYKVENMNCEICESNLTKFLGIRGNLEYAGAPPLKPGQEHIVTDVVRCRKCGFIYTKPLILLDTTKGYEDAKDYKPSADNVPCEDLFRLTLELIEKFTSVGKILDIGCGKGEFLAVAKEKGWQVYGVEPSLQFADYASKKMGIKIERQELGNTNFPDAFFDAITLNMVLEHLDNPKTTIKEIKRILKEGGVLFIEVPNTDSLMLKLASFYFKFTGRGWSPLISPLHYPYHRYGYNIKSLRYLLNSFNFKIKKAILSESNLRGIRFNPSTNNLEKNLCKVTTKISACIGQGDILKVIAIKNNGK